MHTGIWSCLVSSLSYWITFLLLALNSAQWSLFPSITVMCGAAFTYSLVNYIYIYIYIYIYNNGCIEFPLYFTGHKILAYSFIYKKYRQQLQICMTWISLVTNSSIFHMVNNVTERDFTSIRRCVNCPEYCYYHTKVIRMDIRPRY